MKGLGIVLPLVTVVSACAPPKAPVARLPAGCSTDPRIAVLGQVNAPGTYAVGSSPQTITRAIGDAGGLTPLAWRNGITVTRRDCDGRQHRARISLDAILDGRQPDLPLVGGDVVFVWERTF